MTVRMRLRIAHWLRGLTSASTLSGGIYGKNGKSGMMAHLAKGRFLEWLDDPEKADFTADVVLKERLKRLSVHKIGTRDRDYIIAVLNHERTRRTLQ
jgi:hypothetical protein